MKRLLILILLSPTATFCDEKEYQEFRRDIDSAQEKIDYSGKLISHDELHKLIKKNNSDGQNEDSLVDRARRKKEELSPKPSDEPVPDKPHDSTPGSDTNINVGTDGKSTIAPGDKPGSGAVSEVDKPKPATPAEPKPSTQPKPAITAPRKHIAAPKSDVYISPALRNLGNSITDSGPRISNNATLKAPEQRNITYGVTIGTYINVELDTSATNVQPGYVQFFTIEDIIGYKKTLPRRTRLFGQPTAVIGSDKLFVKITTGIDPNTNQEFTLAGNAYDDEGDPGLVAYIVNDGRAIERAADTGTTALGSGLVELIPSNVATDAVKASADSLLRDKQSGDLIQNGRPRYIIQANPQKATIQVERTF